MKTAQEQVRDLESLHEQAEAEAEADKHKQQADEADEADEASEGADILLPRKRGAEAAEGALAPTEALEREVDEELYDN